MYTLMIVDDEPAILDGISRLIDWKSLGFERIKTAQSCCEAISHIVDWKPDVCLVDVRIGKEYGYELINHLNEMGVVSNYIMMSGYDDFQYACEAIRCGALDYLMKPVDKKQLKQLILRIIVERLHGDPQSDVQENMDPVLLRSYEEFSSLIRKILMMVGMEYGQHISLKSIADRFRMNATYLGQIFIKETKMKFTEYLMAFRMTIAREKILNSDDKISAIAAEVGYSNLNYFYQHFHEYYHATPSEVRSGKEGLPEDTAVPERK